jgi:hypothetical protein
MERVFFPTSFEANIKFVNMPIQCTNDGCTDEFANEKELLHHLFVGKCHFEMEFKSSANSDITKKKYFEKLCFQIHGKGLLSYQF